MNYLDVFPLQVSLLPTMPSNISLCIRSIHMLLVVACGY